MAIKTQIRRDGNTTIVSLDGVLDFETTDNLKDNLSKISGGGPHQRVVFDLSGLQFVGSSGISSFIQLLREFNNRAPIRPRYANVRSEFKKLFEAFDEDQSFEFWDSQERAIRSFDQ